MATRKTGTPRASRPGKTAPKRATTKVVASMGALMEVPVDWSHLFTDVKGTENDLRIRVMNSFLVTPHRRLDLLAGLHDNVRSRDPLFYGHLGAWYAQKGEIRDHQELFAAYLITSPLEEHREAGYVLLSGMAPYQVARVVDYCKKTLKKVPRCLRTAVTSYLRSREKNNEFFDSAALRQRKAMKHLYAAFRLAPSERADLILFKDNPPEDSPQYVLKQVLKTQDPVEQARLLIDSKIPFPVAVSVIKGITPAVLVALINAMSPSEVINHMSFLKEHGALNNEEVKALVESKLKAAGTNKRVSAFKAKVAAEASGVDASVVKTLDAVTDARVKQAGTIKMPVALFIDKSGSMSQAIEVGKRIASMVSGISEAALYVYAFDDMPYEVKATGKELSDWEKALKHIRADGQTSIGCPFMSMIQNKEVVDRVIVVTDEGENHTPYFHEAYRRYVTALGSAPSVTIVRIGRGEPNFSQRLQKEGIDTDVFTFSGDYTSLTNLIPLITKSSKLDLLMEIMATPLPKRFAPAKEKVTA